MAALGQKAAVASSNVSARASSAGALRMLYTRHLDTSAAIFAAFYLILRLPQCGASASAVRLTKTTFFPHRVHPRALLYSMLSSGGEHDRHKTLRNREFPPEDGMYDAKCVLHVCVERYMTYVDSSDRDGYGGVKQV